MKALSVWEHWHVKSDNTITVLNVMTTDEHRQTPKSEKVVDTRPQWEYNYDRWIPILTANWNKINKL